MDLGTTVVKNYSDSNTPNAHARISVHADKSVHVVSDYGVTSLMPNSDFDIGKIRKNIIYLSSNVDFDTIASHYVLASGPHSPGDGFWYTETLAYKTDSNGTVKIGKQIAQQYKGGKMATRYCYDSGAWSGWTEYVTNADLAGNTNVINIDDTSIPPGVYAIADETISGNKPFSHGLLLVLRRYGSPVQLAIPAISGFAVKSRSYSSSWGNWQ